MQHKLWIRDSDREPWRSHCQKFACEIFYPNKDITNHHLSSSSCWRSWSPTLRTGWSGWSRYSSRSCLTWSWSPTCRSGRSWCCCSWRGCGRSWCWPTACERGCGCCSHWEWGCPTWRRQSSSWICRSWVSCSSVSGGASVWGWAAWPPWSGASWAPPRPPSLLHFTRRIKTFPVVTDIRWRTALQITTSYSYSGLNKSTRSKGATEMQVCICHHIFITMIIHIIHYNYKHSWWCTNLKHNKIQRSSSV